MLFTLGLFCLQSFVLGILLILYVHQTLYEHAENHIYSERIINLFWFK